MVRIGSELLTAAAPPVIAGAAGGVIGAFGSAGVEGKRAVIGFAAGAFLALAVLHLIPEAAVEIGWPLALAAAALGYALSLAVSRRASSFCPVCSLTGEHAPEPTAPSPTVSHVEPGIGAPLLLVVAIHCGLDGLALSGAGQHGHTAELMSLALLLHKLPEGMALAAVLRSQGQGIGRAIGITVLVEALTLAGVLLGATLLARGAWILSALTGGVGGSFVYLSGLTLLALMRQRRSNLLSALAGALLLILGYVVYR
ncbi:MAG: ZIP family metal transporter [Actinomycetota bacterium]